MASGSMQLPPMVRAIIGLLAAVAVIGISVARVANRAQRIGHKVAAERREARGVQPPPTVPRTSPLDRALPEGEPAFSAEHINEWLPEIRSEVEAVSGRKFKQLPPVKLIRRDELRRLMGQEEGAGGFVDDLPGEAEMTAIIVLGLYDPDDATVYMLPCNFFPMMDLNQNNREFALPLARLVLAHELSHALQDQHLDLKKLDDAVKNMEEAQALRATIEGHATLIEEMVAARMGLEIARPEMAAKRQSDSGAGESDLVKAMIDYQELLSDLYYFKGCDFFRHNFDRGGNPQVWRILADPPRHTAVFIDPGRYWRPGRGIDPLSINLADIASHFGPSATIKEDFSPGSFTLRLMYRDLASKADGFVAMIQSARTMVLVTDDESKFASVAVFELRRTVDPTAFINLIERAPPGLLRQPDRYTELSCQVRSMRKLPGIEAALARDTSVMISEPGASPRQGHVVRVVRKKLVVEVVWLGLELSDQSCAELVGAVLERFDGGGQ